MKGEETTTLGDDETLGIRESHNGHDREGISFPRRRDPHDAGQGEHAPFPQPKLSTFSIDSHRWPGFLPIREAERGNGARRKGATVREKHDAISARLQKKENKKAAVPVP
jgi:hypothetical protein